MKLYVNREPKNGPWGGGNAFVKAIYDHYPKGDDVICQPRDQFAVPDTILIVGLNGEDHCASIHQALIYQIQMNSNVKIVLRVNENDARKGTNSVDKEWIHVSQYVDGTVFVSDWLKNYFLKKGWKCKRNTVIKNGVDRSIFKPGQKLNNGKINIVTHHWSDNYLKGFDIYDKLDEFVRSHADDFSFTYIGRHRNTFSRATKVIDPLHGSALGDELGKYDVYVSASRNEPGPNHGLESIACGLPTYVHKDGGACIEFAGDSHVYRDWNHLKSILIAKKFESNDIQISSWLDCVEEYRKFLSQQ